MSYRREDSAGHTGRLHDRLSAKWGDDRIFWDIDNIAPGEDFVDAIDRTLDGCDVVVLVIGPRWLEAKDALGTRRLDIETDFHRLEIERAMQRNLRIVPVLVGGARMPSQGDLPKTIQGLARRQAFELTDKRFGFDVSNLANAIERLLEESATTAATEGAPHSAQASSTANDRAAAPKGASAPAPAASAKLLPNVVPTPPAHIADSAVDPVTEAEVYLAYGRDIQAEQILKEAMVADPGRMAIRALLLKVYAKRRDAKGFELLARQMHTLTHGEGTEWAKAQELGLTIDPDNALYARGSIP